MNNPAGVKKAPLVEQLHHITQEVYIIILRIYEVRQLQITSRYIFFFFSQKVLIFFLFIATDKVLFSSEKC